MVRKAIILPTVILVMLLGIGVGIGSFTFWYAKGFSYLSDKPEACNNCHVMNSVFEGWMKGGHQHVAVCNDCHVPHNFIGKWYTKADNGLHHSFAFTFTNVPVVIRAREMSKRIVQDNCIRCHSNIAEHAIFGLGDNVEAMPCISCHREVAHPHN